MLRIAFVCSSLERGGLSYEVEANARLALADGHEVRIVTPYKVRDDSPARCSLRDVVPFNSVQEAWRQTLRGRVLYHVARAKKRLATSRGCTAEEDVRLARRFMPPATDLRFWDAHADDLLRATDIVHLFGKPKPFLARTMIRAEAQGLRTIFEEASQVTTDYAQRPDHQAFIAACNLCDVVVARCERHVERIRALYGYGGEARVIDQWAYATEAGLLAIDRERPAATHECVFGTMGRLDAGKGLEVLIEAAARVMYERPAMQLVIAGEGAADTSLRALARARGIADRVRFVGNQDADNKIAFYASLDAFVITSQSEGGPITGVEAMAAALPIISTPVGAMPERLANGAEALFFDIDRVDGLVAAMCMLADNPALRHDLGCAARRRYERRNHSRISASQKRALWPEFARHERQ